MNISMDHLALCTPGLTGFSVESWRLKPAHFLLETVVSAALKFAPERVEDREAALSNFAHVLYLLLREGGENLK